MVRTDEPLGSPAHVYAESSLCELLGDFVEEEQLVAKTARQALARVPRATRGGCPGEVGVGDAQRGCLIYHANALAALRRVEEVWGGEAEAEIAVSGGRVVARDDRASRAAGGWRGARFSYGKTLAACTRTVLEDEVFTALYGYGKGPADPRRAGRAHGRLHEAAHLRVCERRRELGGRRRGARGLGSADGAGGKAHRFGHVVFPDCEDPYELMGLTRSALRAACAPRVSYEVDVAAVDGGAGVRLGDNVAVVDDSRAPAWHLRARCVRRVRELGEGEPVARLTLGTVERTTWAASAEVAARVSAVEETAATASDTVASYEDLGTRGF